MINQDLSGKTPNFYLLFPTAGYNTNLLAHATYLSHIVVFQ
jgi:hypothetical protein